MMYFYMSHHGGELQTLSEVCVKKQQINFFKQSCLPNWASVVLIYKLVNGKVTSLFFL